MNISRLISYGRCLLYFQVNCLWIRFIWILNGRWSIARNSVEMYERLSIILFFAHIIFKSTDVTNITCNEYEKALQFTNTFPTKYVLNLPVFGIVSFGLVRGVWSLWHHAPSRVDRRHRVTIATRTEIRIKIEWKLIWSLKKNMTFLVGWSMTSSDHCDPNWKKNTKSYFMNPKTNIEYICLWMKIWFE